LIKQFRFSIAPLLLIERCQVVEADSYIRMVRSQLLFMDCPRSLI